MKKLIVTKDEASAEELKRCGYTLIQKKEDGTYTFLNDGNLSFDQKKLKVAFSNLIIL